MAAAKHSTSKQQLVAILDAGSQYGGLIDRNVRELGLRTALLPLDTPVTDLKAYQAIIISGGPKSVADEDAYLCDPQLFGIGKPILGICYGMQLLAKYSGGEVGPNELREDGPQLTTFTDSALFAGLAGEQRVLMSHGDSVSRVPDGFQISGKSKSLISAIEQADKHLYGVQFHPEVFQTERGGDIFRNFLFSIAGLEANYTLDDQEAEALTYIKEVTGKRDIVVFVSGGVDSAVVAALVARALPPERIHAFHIDTGLMRADESQQVISALAAAGLEVTLLDEADTFYSATTLIDGVETLPLCQVTDPQTKRKIIGDTFITIRADILRRYGLAEDTVLAQGSLRPDLIESGSVLASTKADTIKTHHNDTEAVRALRAQNSVVEPLQQLYKDQVRALGRRLGLPAELVERHPFPGPGLAIRLLCAETAYRLPDHKKLQAELDNFMTEQADAKAYTASLLPVRTVGVQGDGRSYKYLVGLQGPPNWDRLREVAATIPNYNHAVNRVCYVFGEPIDRTTLDITPTHFDHETLEQLRQADAIVTKILHDYDLLGNISQMPVVLFPVNFGIDGARSIALRPFKTPDFMTGLAILPGEMLPEIAVTEMVEQILQSVPSIARVVLDISSKPPGTTEWE